MPDSLTPPNGAPSYENAPVLTPTIAELQRLADPPDAGDVAREEVRGKAGLGGVGHRDRLVLGRKRKIGASGPNVSSRATRMSGVAPSSTVGLVERAAEIVRAAAGRHGRALRRARRRRAARPSRPPASSISGPSSTPVVEAVAHRQRARRRPRTLDERVVDPVLHENPVGAHAGLPGVAELGRDRALDRQLEVGIVEHDQRRVAAELERDLLDRACALRHQLLADLGRAGEGELADDRVRRELVADDRRLARHDVEDARRQARRSPSSASASAESGVALAGLSTIVQPAASAGPALRGIIAIGKFHGVIAAQTPIGCFCTSMRRPATFVGIVSP